MNTMVRYHQEKAFTLIELLLVVTIIAILFAVLLFGDIPQLFKGYDAVRKSDLHRIKTALESYYSDHDCYPSTLDLQNFLNQCGSTTTDLTPYLQEIPCDPRDHTTPYVVVTDGLACAQKFRIYTKLDNIRDTAIYEADCTDGCGPGLIYNYNVPSSNLSNRHAAPVTLFYCAALNNCANLDPELTCDPKPTYTDNRCNAECTNPNNYCTPVLR